MEEMRERIIKEESDEIVLRRAHEELPQLQQGLLNLAQLYPVAFMLTVEKSIERAGYYLKMEEEIRGAAEKKREEELLKEAIRHNQEELERQREDRSAKAWEARVKAEAKRIKKGKKKKRIRKKKVKNTQRDFGLIKKKK